MAAIIWQKMEQNMAPQANDKFVQFQAFMGFVGESCRRLHPRNEAVRRSEEKKLKHIFKLNTQ
jgi:transposase